MEPPPSWPGTLLLGGVPHYGDLVVVREPVRVALRNDYEIVVRGLAVMLQPYADRVEVVELDSRLPAARPVDVVLYDTFGQDQGDRLTVADLVGETSARVVVYSWNLQSALVSTSVTRGVAGYLSKGLSAEQLVAAIERVHAGEKVVESAAIGDEVPGAWPGKEHGLSAREAEVLALITQGLTNEQIARRSYLSINSVKSYVRSAYRKTGVSSRSQAVLWGVRHGFEPDVVRRPGPGAA